MQGIVLITRENSERVTRVSVFLCGNYIEAKHFCHFVNRLSLAGGDKLAARRVVVNVEYSLEKYQPFGFDDFVKLDNRTMQKVIRETDSRILAIALKNAKKEVTDKFLMNMLKRGACMLKKNMEHMAPVTEPDIENARQLILDIYDELTGENMFDEAWTRYRDLKESGDNNQTDNVKNHIVLLFREAGDTAGFVSVYLFNDENSASAFCRYLNDLEPDNGLFFYARYAEQMVEYETIKPLLVSIDKIFEISRLHGECNAGIIIREALKKFSIETLSKAIIRLDKNSRIFILQNLPVKTRDEVNKCIESYDNIPLSYSREAQNKIMDAINRIYDKFRLGKFSKNYEVLKS